VLRTRPDLVKRWTDEKVATHWLYLYPKRRGENGKACEPIEEEIAEITGNKERLLELRGRLSSLSWFNRYLKEKIARRANSDDETTGHFWKGPSYYSPFRCWFSKVYVASIHDNASRERAQLLRGRASRFLEFGRKLPVGSTSGLNVLQAA
jgi:hypothetical protein